jgi:thiol:disulfide interchange protein DsbD
MTRFFALAALILGIAGVAPWAASAAPVKALPANADLKASITGAAELQWGGDLSSALKQAGKDKQFVFIDFTGVTCTNCKLNEKTVFTKPEVKELLAKYVRVQLYTDEVPGEFYNKDPGDEKRESDAEANRKFQKVHFKTEQLPLYAIVRPASDEEFEVVATYDEGRINKVDAFVAFLKKALSKD